MYSSTTSYGGQPVKHIVKCQCDSLHAGESTILSPSMGIRNVLSVISRELLYLSSTSVTVSDCFSAMTGIASATVKDICRFLTLSLSVWYRSTVPTLALSLCSGFQSKFSPQCQARVWCSPRDSCMMYQLLLIGFRRYKLLGLPSHEQALGNLFSTNRLQLSRGLSAVNKIGLNVGSGIKVDNTPA